MPAVYVETRDVPLDELTPFPGNAKRGDVDAVRLSLRRNGQYRALVVRQVDRGPLIVLAGNHTMRALAAEGQATARCEIITCDDHEARRINLADNRTADLGVYDDEALAALLSELAGDYDGTGYTEADLQALAAEPKMELLDPFELERDAPPEPPAEPVTQSGDIWILGPHRIICGDCRDIETVTHLLDGRSINIAFTSPPYASQRTYDEASGFKPIPAEAYVDWFEDVQASVRAHLAADGSWFVNIKEHSDGGQRSLYVKDLTTAHVRRWGWCFIDEFCWVDTKNGVPGAWPNRFKDAWEPIFHFSATPKIKFDPWANATPTLAAFEYQASNAESSTGSGLLGSGNSREMSEGLARPSNVLRLAAASNPGVAHSAVFPVDLPEWFIKAFTDNCDTVFDPFMGSGSTLLAAQRTGRTAYGTEISPAYCDVMCRRFQQVTGVTPVLESSGESHDFDTTPGSEGSACLLST